MKKRRPSWRAHMRSGPGRSAAAWRPPVRAACICSTLYDAKFDRAPVLAITGLPDHDLLQTSTQQDIDHVRLFQDVTEHSTIITGAEQMAQAVTLACRTALARRGVTHIAVPSDIQDQSLDADQPSPRNTAGATSAFGRERIAPDDGDVARAAEILNAGRKVAILAGQDASGAVDALLETATLLDAPIAKALLGKAILADTHPYVTGGVGDLGARPSQQALAACDTLLIVGSTFPYIKYYPKPDQVRSLQIDIDPAHIGLRFPVDVGVVGDAGEALRALNPRLTRKDAHGFVAQAQQWKREWEQALHQAAERPGTPMKPQRVVRDRNERLAPDAMIAADCGQNTGLTAQSHQHPRSAAIRRLGRSPQWVAGCRTRSRPHWDQGTPGRDDIIRRLHEEPAATSLKH